MRSASSGFAGATSSRLIPMRRSIAGSNDRASSLQSVNLIVGPSRFHTYAGSGRSARVTLSAADTASVWAIARAVLILRREDFGRESTETRYLEAGMFWAARDTDPRTMTITETRP